MILIGITGRMGSGKDTVCAIARNYLQGCDVPAIQTSFAYELKKDLNVFFPKGADKDIPGYRKMLQGYGMAMRHVHGDDYWVGRLHTNITKAAIGNLCKVCIITDVRYANEAKFIKDLGGEIVRVHANEEYRINRIKERGDVDLASLNDPSETGMFREDWAVINNTTLENLKTSTEFTIKKILEAKGK